MELEIVCLVLTQNRQGIEAACLLAPRPQPGPLTWLCGVGLRHSTPSAISCEDGDKNGQDLFFQDFSVVGEASCHQGSGASSVENNPLDPACWARGGQVTHLGSASCPSVWGGGN